MHRGHGPRKKLRFLAFAYQSHQDELLADFQQFYHLNIWDFGLDGDETTPDVLRAAILAYQLPKDSRTWTAIVPALAHDESRQILRRIEYNQRAYAWAQADKKKRGPEPEPMTLSGEDELKEEQARREKKDQESVAEFLGINL